MPATLRQLGAVWQYLERAGRAPGQKGALATRDVRLGVEAASRHTRQALHQLERGSRQAPAALAASLWLANPTLATAELAAMAARVPLSPEVQQSLAQVLRSQAPAAHAQQLLERFMPDKLVLLLLETRLKNLQAINKILLSWGKFLRKMAERDKKVHAQNLVKEAVAKAHAQAGLHNAQEFARVQLASIAQHYAQIGVATSRALRAGAMQEAATADRLILTEVDAGRSLMSWPNMSLKAALTLPMAYGFRLRPRSYFFAY